MSSHEDTAGSWVMCGSDFTPGALERIVRQGVPALSYMCEKSFWQLEDGLRKARREQGEEVRGHVEW